MPKVLKKRLSSSSRSSPLSRPSLETELKQAQETGKLRPPKKQRIDTNSKLASLDDDLDTVNDIIPSTLSKKIIRQAQTQQAEEEEKDDEPHDDSTRITREDNGSVEEDLEEPHDKRELSSKQHKLQQRPLFRLRDESDITTSPNRRYTDDDDEDDDISERQSSIEDDEEIEELEISPEDEASLSVFLPPSLTARRTLADIIMEKIQQQQQQQQHGTPAPPPLDEKIIAVYSQVGTYLSHYTSGKIPKAFKIIPSLQNWEQILYLTSPQSWSPQAYYQATRLFAANLNEHMAQRYYHDIILPRIRSDIANNPQHHLNYHLYQSLRKMLFKPAAFFRGLVLPWANDQITVKESIILASVLSKYSIAPLHAAVCLMKLSQLEYSGPIMLLIQTLINKQYALPYRVIQTVVDYFYSYITDRRGIMPLIWHRTLLIFIQRYKLELTSGQIKKIKELIKIQQHSGISKEIKRELTNIVGRDREVKQTNGTIAMPRTTNAATVVAPPVRMEVA